MPEAASVSVVIPTYNYGHFLPRAIDSVLGQTCAVHETIVVDDGSTDNTRDVVAKYGDKVRYIYKQNGGLSAARNTGIRAAQGDWIGLLDSDDAWLPRKNEAVQQFVQQNPEARFIYHPAFYFLNDEPWQVIRCLEPDALWPELCHLNLISNGSAAVMHRSLFDELGGFDETLPSFEDWEMWIRVANRHRLHKISEVLSHCWLHEGSLGKDRLKTYRASRMLVDKGLTAALSWPQRWWVRQHFLAFNAYDCSLEMRHNDRANARMALLQSLRDWPSPFYLPGRWWALLLTLAGKV